VIAEYGADKPGRVNTLSAADGSFEARGEWTTTELVVRAIHEDCWNAVHQRVERGSEGVELRLERFATVSGMLAMRNGGALPDLRVTLTNRDTAKLSDMRFDFASQPDTIVRRDSNQATCTRDGAFIIRGLRPGPYELVVVGDRSSGETGRIPEILLGAGQHNIGPLLLEERVRETVPIAIEVADFPRLDAGRSLRCYFHAEYNLLDDPPEDPSILLDGRGQASLDLPAAGRYELLWNLETADSGLSEMSARQLVPEHPQFVEVEATHTRTLLRLAFDAAQLEQLSRKH